MPHFGLIGYPLTHSFSPQWFHTFFKEQGLTGHQYRTYPLPNLEGLQALFEQDPNLMGLNVTIPYKEAVIPMLDWVHPTAQEVGAVNCITKVLVHNQWELHGYNTDVIGFKESVLLHFPELNDTHTALIFGHGGAAKAARHVFHSLEVSTLTVGRNPLKADITYQALIQDPSPAHKALIWVQTTPCGMYPNTQEALPLPYNALTPKHLLFDMIYNPPQTLTMQYAKNKGARVCNGYNMLEKQARASAQIWKLCR